MNWTESSESYRPVLWVRGYPFYFATLFIALHVLAMIGCAFASFLGAGNALNYLHFSSQAVLHQTYLWQYLTYAFIHPPSLNFALEMLGLYWFGPEVEKFIGSRNFLFFYLSSLLLTSLVLTGVGLFQPTLFAGSELIHLAVFIGFAVIYPSAEFFFRLTAKWVALIVLGIYVLQCLAYHQWVMLIALTANALWAYSAMHFAGVQGGASWWEEWWQQRRLERLARKHQLRIVREQEIQLNTDAILEKISQQGLHSLSDREKAALEQARVHLLEKERQP